MASSGVWENVILPKTPTFEGVSGILYFIILLNFCQIFLVLLTDGKSTVIMLTDVKSTLIKVMTDVIVILLFTTDVWQMLFPCGIWPLTNAFVTDVIVTFCGMDPLLR